MLGGAFRAAAAALVLGLLVPASAHATFPGSNGEIAYTCERADEESDICGVAADGSAQRTIFKNAAGAAWSPDSVHLAYGGNFVSDTRAAGRPATLSRLALGINGNNLAWSPDGAQIAYDSDGISVVGVFDKKSRRLTDGGAADAEPDWSPDGRRIAFHSNRAGRYEIYTVDVGSGAVTQLTSSPTGSATSPTWSPDGSRIGFVRTQSDEEGASESDLHVVNADGSGARPITDRFGAGVRTGGGVQDPAWSPDGTRIGFAYVTEGTGELRTIAADGSGEAPIGVRGYGLTWGTAPGTGPIQPPGIPSISRVKFARSLWSAPVFLLGQRGRRREGATLSFRMSAPGLVGVVLESRRRPRRLLIGTIRARRGTNKVRIFGTDPQDVPLPKGSYRIELTPFNALIDKGRAVRTKRFRVRGLCTDRPRRPCRPR